MARPERKNADYFPFYAKDGRTLFLLESKYHCKGTGFFTNVMRFLTLETNHHVSIQDETDSMYFFSKCHCDSESGIDMLDIMSKTGKINKELWSIRVIVSEDLLNSLVDAYRNRKNTIITIPELIQKYITDVKNPVSDTGNPQEPVVSDVKKPQRKLKETKGKEIVLSAFPENAGKKAGVATAFPKKAELSETFYLTKKKKKLTGWKLETFEKFWISFNWKKDKANAADAWLQIPGLTQDLANEKIIPMASLEADNRQNILDRGGTPKWAQGWISGRRWEDEQIVQTDEWAAFKARREAEIKK